MHSIVGDVAGRSVSASAVEGVLKGIVSGVGAIRGEILPNHPSHCKQSSLPALDVSVEYIPAIAKLERSGRRILG